MKHFEELSREELLKLIQIHPKYWLANDACFFCTEKMNWALQELVNLAAL